MNCQRLAFQVLLALVLVLAQQLGAAHRLGHAVEQVAGLAHQPACETCLGLAAFDQPAPAAVVAVPLLPAGIETVPALRGAGFIAHGGQGFYRSRAPPLRG
jgi:hypothetical protein